MAEVGQLITHDLEKTDAVREPAPIVAHIAKARKGGNMLIDAATTSNEHYSPLPYMSAVRGVMGRINLDPASCSKANLIVMAQTYHGQPPAEDVDDCTWSGHTDGLHMAQVNGWFGNVYVNPPGGYIIIDGKRVSCTPQWWRTLVQQWQRGNVEQAIFLAFNMNVFRTAQSFADVMPPFLFPFCVPKDRICFDRLDAAGLRVPGKQPPQDSAIIYLPPAGHTARDLAVSRFARVFGQFGAVRV